MLNFYDVHSKTKNNHILVGIQKGVLLHGQVHTTLARAKKCRPVLEKAITLAKHSTLDARRRLIAKLGVSSAKHLIETIAPKFINRHGGYTRIIKNGYRRGDCAPVAVLSLVE